MAVAAVALFAAAVSHFRAWGALHLTGPNQARSRVSAGISLCPCIIPAVRWAALVRLKWRY